LALRGERRKDTGIKQGGSDRHQIYQKTCTHKKASRQKETSRGMTISNHGTIKMKVVICDINVGLCGNRNTGDRTNTGGDQRLLPIGGQKNM